MSAHAWLPTFLLHIHVAHPALLCSFLKSIYWLFFPFSIQEHPAEPHWNKEIDGGSGRGPYVCYHSLTLLIEAKLSMGGHFARGILLGLRGVGIQEHYHMPFLSCRLMDLQIDLSTLIKTVLCSFRVFGICRASTCNPCSCKACFHIQQAILSTEAQPEEGPKSHYWLY